MLDLLYSSLVLSDSKTSRILCLKMFSMHLSAESSGLLGALRLPTEMLHPKMEVMGSLETSTSSVLELEKKVPHKHLLIGGFNLLLLLQL